MPSFAMLSLALAAAGIALCAGCRGWRARSRSDGAFALALASWAALNAVTLFWPEEMPRLGEHALQTMLLQLTLLGAEAFLLISAGVWASWARLPWRAHGGVSALYTLACVLDWHDGHARTTLLAINIGFFGALALLLAAQAWHSSTGRAWALLLVALPVGTIMLGDMLALDRSPARLSAFQPVVALQLSVLWLALQHGNASVAVSDGDEEDLHSRLMQDLHDGVGSRLTTLIAALEQGTPQQRGTAILLQQCLFDLKLLVDGARTQGSVVCHLANLRYRVQPLLDGAGIALHWEIEPNEQLERVQGDAATEVLRIAQEALANAVRHSGGHAVVVRCKALFSPPALLLEVHDNGRGLPFPGGADWAASHRAHGHGLGGMRLRAARLGGTLQLDSLPGEGTCVRLEVPIPDSAPPPPPGPNGRWFLPRSRSATV